MADNDSTDMLMAVTGENGGKLAGQGLAALDTSDTEMLDGITAGFFTEIQDISFGIGVEDSEPPNPINELHAIQVDLARHTNKNGEKPDDKEKKNLASLLGSPKKTKQFKNFVDTGRVTDDDDNPVYSTVFDPITISRPIDQMSPFILYNCAYQKALQRIVVVKRKVTGNTGFHEAFVRLQFDECLITAVDWDHGDTFTEKMKFVYRTLTVKYRPQSNDGTLAAPKTMTYSMAMQSA